MIGGTPGAWGLDACWIYRTYSVEPRNCAAFFAEQAPGPVFRRVPGELDAAVYSYPPLNV